MSNHPGVILLVDDSADDVFLTRRAFEQSEITNQIVVARDGVEALALLLPEEEGRVPLRPAIMLLDINMPRIGGLEVLARLRTDPLTLGLPVIMLTTSLEERDMMESCHLGANSYVLKPVTTSGFLVAARTLGMYWLGVHRQPEGQAPPRPPV